MMLAYIQTKYFIFGRCTHTDGFIYTQADQPCDNAAINDSQSAGLGLDKKLAGVPVKNA